MADFIAEFTKPTNQSGAGASDGQAIKGNDGAENQAAKLDRARRVGVWNLFCDGSSNSRGAGAGILIITPPSTMDTRPNRIGSERSLPPEDPTSPTLTP